MIDSPIGLPVLGPYGVRGKITAVSQQGLVVTIKLERPVAGHKNLLWQCHPSQLEISKYD
tara:strand:+ start:360 stop:539 length:180 start_codon:yes stop_codon:yes gene_type:complete